MARGKWNSSEYREDKFRENKKQKDRKMIENFLWNFIPLKVLVNEPKIFSLLPFSWRTLLDIKTASLSFLPALTSLCFSCRSDVKCLQSMCNKHNQEGTFVLLSVRVQEALYWSLPLSRLEYLFDLQLYLGRARQP